MAQVYFGSRRTTATSSGENLSTGTAYGQSFGIVSASQAGRVIAIGGWIGANNQPMNGRWSAYTHQGGSGAPHLLMGNTDLGSISWNWTGGSGGQNFERSIVSVESGFGASENGIVVRPGDQPHVVFQGDETARHAYTESTGKVRSNRTLAGTTPPDPFAFTSQTANAREYSWYLVIEQNRAPVLSNVGPDAVTLNTLNPVFSFRFTDADRTAGYNDYPRRAIVRVYENNAGALTFKGAHTENLPNPGSGTSFVDVSFDYQGPALTMEKSYVYTLEVQDEVGGTSGTTYAGTISGTTTPDASLTFDLSTKGDIAPTGPSGKQTTLTPGPFTGTYTHPSGSALDKVQLRILKRNNLGQYAVSQTSALLDIANVSSGGAVSVSWATSGFTTLAWGEDYAVEWKLTSADASVSDWGGRQTFWTNKLPQQPLITSPEEDDFFASLPELFAYVFDEDDTPAGSLTAQYEITGPYALANGEFEANITGWTYSETSASFVETVSHLTVSPIAGVGSLKVAMSATPTNTSSTYSLEPTDRFPCVPGYLYTVEAKVKNDTANTSVGLLAIRFYTSGGALVSTLGTTEVSVDTTTGVKTLVASAIAPATAATFAPIPGGRNSAAASSAWNQIWDSVIAYPGVRFVRAATHVGDNSFRYPMVSADATTLGVYTIRARGADANNSGPWSAPVLFTYGTGITGTLTNPTAGAVLSTSSPQFVWTVGSGGPQTRYRVDVQDADTGENVYDSEWVVSADTGFTMPPGYVGSGGSYLGRLWLDNGSSQVLVDTVNFSTSYAAPAALADFQATPFQHPGEPEASSIILTWTPIDTDPGNVERVEIWADEGNGAKRIVTFEGAIGAGVSSFVYPFPRSGVEIEFTARQIVQQNNGNVENGLWAQAWSRVDLTALYLVSTVSPMERRLAIRYWQETSESKTQVQQWSTPAGALDYVEVPGSLRGRDASLSAQFIDHQDGSGITAQQDQETFDALFDGILSDDGELRTSDILCYRDPRQYKHFTRFNGNPSTRHGKGAIRFATTFALRRVSYVEGV